MADHDKPLPSPRRIGTERSKTRLQLLDAAEQLMCAEGYAAVTSRRLAAFAGLKPQLVHYYFRTMDDLFVDLFNRLAEQYLERQRQVLEHPEPLKSLWAINCDHERGMLTMEFIALANHRKVIGTAIKDYATRARELQAEILTQVLEKKGVDTRKWPPLALAFALECIPRVLVMETTYNVSCGHEEMLALAVRLMEQMAEPAGS